MQPMLATATDTVPTGPDWVHEVKWDGMRILAHANEGRTRLVARSGSDATARLPELAHLTSHTDSVFDGEVVALDGGAPSFSRLARRMHVRDAATATALAQSTPVTYVVFDVLRLDGVDLTSSPWRVRRAALESITWADPHVLVAPTYDDGPLLLAATAEQGLEGVVSKRLDARYQPGRRSPDWRKLPHRPTASVVVGGWRSQVGDPTTLGALLVGHPLGSDQDPGTTGAGGGLRFVGRVGSGLGVSAALDLMPLLLEHASDTAPFTPAVPRADATDTHWVQPRLVVDVRSLGRADLTGGRLRHPSYHGLRLDLTPGDLLDSPTADLDPDLVDDPTGER